ncbi:hypothetical protein DPSP01_003024 [Paraphaeosphaeria sporulosa]|uniref:Uncharacterized protein n=1 Tax=Paraphaeosphaeria sporulosa TaxID=1460663 RepID=A0A177CML1_9PLEO|nr:uncharacterized protein CC84DRAFT_1214652 [Paraphaeosphaeria sporulosa]OAG08118.1 hypothetical protein CC84DRAFT_1214652 [Paraphaeosphaeria sporulosa]
MGLLSLLPDEYASVETWLKRLFFLLGVVTLGPWAFLVVYDLVLYIVRSVTYEIPFVGGRARGKARPRAPSLTERPSGHRRKFSLARRREPESPTSSAFQSSPQDTRWRNIQEETHDAANKTSLSSDSTD